MSELIEPLDATHSESVLAVMNIRDRVAYYRAYIHRWVPRPMPPTFGQESR